ncbi:MAG: hypothetical protein GX098_06395 [Bacteroidales bacterium]|nr:hypothetical protein [Bacteroidales bacterium]
MKTVGILAADQKWSTMLSGDLEAMGCHIAGWVNPLVSDQRETDRLIDASDLVWIPENLDGGFADISRVIRKSRHVSLGFPVSDFIDEAQCLLDLAREARVQIQAGYSERHLPVYRSIRSYLDHPQHIQIIHQPGLLSSANPEREAVLAVFADLDLAIGLVGSTVKKVRPHATWYGGSLLSQIDARIEFFNGLVINLIINTDEAPPTRQFFVRQHNGVILLDLLNNTSRFTRYIRHDERWHREEATLWPPDPSGDTKEDTLPERIAANQCLRLIHSLQQGQEVHSGLEESFQALRLTRQIEKALYC